MPATVRAMRYLSLERTKRAVGSSPTRPTNSFFSPTLHWSRPSAGKDTDDGLRK